MPEQSVMHQAMDTWRKGECVDIAKVMFLIPAALNSVLDPIWQREPKSIILENVDYLISGIDGMKSIITEEQYRHIRSEAIRIKDIIEKVKRKSSDEEIGQVLHLVGSIRRALPIMAGEAIVKCQSGKSEEIKPTGFTKGQIITIKPEFRYIYHDYADVIVLKDDPENNQVLADNPIIATVSYDHILKVLPPKEAVTPTLKLPETKEEWLALGVKIIREKYHQYGVRDKVFGDEVDDRVHAIQNDLPGSEDAKRWLITRAGELDIKEY